MNCGGPERPADREDTEMSHPDALEGLAEKLAAANLNDAEAELLTALLQGADEVGGFAMADPSAPVGIKLGEKTIDPTSQKHWIDCTSLQFKMGM